MARTLHRPIAGLMVASLALVLAACGDDDDDSAASSTSTAPQATEATEAPVSTEEPVSSEAPASTEAPVATEAPVSTEAPATSEAPASSEAPAAEPLRIGFLPPALDIPAFQGLWHGLEGYGGGRYKDTVVAVDAKFDPSIQVQTIQQWVELDQVDAIWVIPVAGEAIAPQIQAAADAGIAVIAGGVPVDFGFDGPMAGVTFSAVDNVEFGKGIGDLMAACVNDRLGGESSVIYVGPNVPSQTTTDINEQSKKALASGAPAAEIVQELVAAADQATTQQMVESALQGNPDTDGFMAGDAEATMAGLNAYSGAGKDPTKICIVGNGGTDDQVAAVDKGELYGVVAFDFEADLMQNVDELHRLAADPTVEGQLLTVPINIVGG